MVKITPEGESAPDSRLGFSPFSGTIWSELDERSLEVLKGSWKSDVVVDPKVLEFLPGVPTGTNDAEQIHSLLSLVAEMQGKKVNPFLTRVTVDQHVKEKIVFTCEDAGMSLIDLKLAKVDIVDATNKILKLFEKAHI